MKNRTSTTLALLALAIFAGLVVGVGLSKIGAARRETGTRSRTAPKAAAEDTRTLKEKAKATGKHVEIARPEKADAYADIAALAADSSDVVIGFPLDNVTDLTADGRSLNINYTVRIEHVYKGELKKGSTITVSLPGGMFRFDDGSTAEVRTPWFKKMQKGKAYALFLKAQKHGQSYVPTGGAQGLFEIGTSKEDHTVKSHVGLPNNPMWRYHGREARVFLSEVRMVTQ